MILDKNKCLLVHSYQNYPNNIRNLNISNNYFYCNNKCQFGVANIPNDNTLYKIKLENTKIKDKNLKISVEINTKKMLTLIEKKKKIPQKDELFSLLYRNKILKDEEIINIDDCINFNKIYHNYSSYNECEINNSVYLMLNLNHTKFNELVFDYTKKSIYHHKNYKYIQTIPKGGIIFNDLVEYDNYLIKIIKNTNLNLKTLILTKNTKYWVNILNLSNNVIININDININDMHGKNYLNKKYYRLIIDDCLDVIFNDNIFEKIKNINTTIRWFTTSNFYNYNFIDLKNIINLIFNVNLDKYNFDFFIFNYSKFLFRNKCKKIGNFKKKYFHLNNTETNFYDLYKNNIDKDIFYSLSLNFTKCNFISTENLLLKFNINLKKKIDCSICLEKVKNNNFGITKCGHVFCYSCLYKAICLKKKCPLCNTKLSFKNIYKISNQLDNNLDNCVDMIPNKIKYIINLSNQQKFKIVIFSNYKKTIENVFNTLKNLNKNFVKKNVYNLYYLENNINKYKETKIIVFEEVTNLKLKYFICNNFNTNNIECCLIKKDTI